MKRWLILTNFPVEKGGLQIRTKELCEELLTRGYYIEIWNFRENHFSFLKEKYPKTCQISSFKNYLTRKINIKNLIFAYNKIKKSNIDVIFFCIPGTPDFLPYILAAKLADVKHIIMHVGANPSTSIPYPINLKNLVTGFGRWWWRFYVTCWLSMQCVTLALFNNDYQLKKFSELFGLNFAQKYLWWPPINLNLFRPNREARIKVREQLKLNNYFVFGSVGRLNPQKSFDILIKAFAKILNKIKAKLVIVGGGDLYSDLKNLSISLGIEKDVVLLGERSDVHHIINAFDVFVFSSSDYNETLGIAVLEAMACGLPCIVSNIPGPKRIVGDNEYGLLFKSKNASDLAEKMLLLYENKQLRDYYARKALQRSKVCKRETVVDNLLQLLNN